MCQALEVAQSGFYRWEKAPISKRQHENNRIKERVKIIFRSHQGMVGSPLVTADLRDEHEFSKVSRPRVARIMRELGLRCKATKKFVVTTDSKHNHPVAPNLLDRNFTVSALDVAWVGDITSNKGTHLFSVIKLSLTTIKNEPAFIFELFLNYRVILDCCEAQNVLF